MRELGERAVAALVLLADRGGRVEGAGSWPEICGVAGFRCPDSLVGRYVAESRVDLPGGGMDLAYDLLPRGWAVADGARIRESENHTTGDAVRNREITGTAVGRNHTQGGAP